MNGRENRQESYLGEVTIMERVKRLNVRRGGFTFRSRLPGSINPRPDIIIDHIRAVIGTELKLQERRLLRYPPTRIPGSGEGYSDNCPPAPS